MFDYQAGEKYKMTLIMVGVAGAMAGVFFTLILSPTPVPTKHRQRSKADSHPDVTGVARPHSERYPQSSASQGQPPPVDAVDNFKATALVEGFLPLAWDFNAASAANSQQSAMSLMTPDCAQSYITNIWTPEMATTIANSGMKSKWNQRLVSARPNQADGSIEIVVEGEQELQLPGEPPKPRPVKFVYLVKKASDGTLKIAGISEG
jgi:hypothetical protein